MSIITNKGISISTGDNEWSISKPTNGIVATSYNSTSVGVKSSLTLIADSTVKSAIIDISLSSFGSTKNGIYVATDMSHIGSFVGDESGDFEALVYGNKQFIHTNKYTWYPSSSNGNSIYLVYVGYETPNDNISIIVTPTSSSQTYYFNITVYDTSSTPHLVGGASVGFYSLNGTVFLGSRTTDANGVAEYSTSDYSSCLCKIRCTGYSNSEIRITGTTDSGSYRSVFLTPNDPSVLTTNEWYNIDAKQYVGKGAIYARGVRLSKNAGTIIDRQRMLTYSNSNSGTAIVELYAHKRTDGSASTPTYGLYNISSGSFSSQTSYVFDFTNMSSSPNFSGKPSEGDRIIYSTHCIYGKNWSSSGNLAVAAKGSSAENQFIYNSVTDAKNKWTSYTDYNGVKYYSITVDENNHKSYTTLSVKKDYKYTFSIFTYSQASFDGIAITEGLLTSSVSSLSDVTNALKKASGVNTSSGCVYDAAEDKTLYIYFLTDVITLGNIYTSNGTEVEDGYCYADIKVTEVSKVAIPTVTNKVYDGSVQKPFDTDAIDSSIVSYQGIISSANVGSYSITFKLIDNSRYIWSDDSLTDKTFTWSITRRPITITAKSNSKTYDGTAIQANGTTSSNIVAGHTYTCTLTRIGDGIDVGTYRVTPSDVVIRDASGFDVTSNYYITCVSNTLVVNKKTVDINYSTITSSTVYCTDTAEVKTSLVSAKSVALASSAWTIEGGGAITYTLQVNNGSSTVSGWTLSSDGKTLTIPSGTDAGTYKVNITVYAAGTANYNSTSDLKQIVVNAMATSISSYGSVSAPVYTQKSDFPAGGVILTASNIGSYLTPSGSSQTITYNNGATRNGSISYAWSGSYNVSNLDTDNIDRKSLTLTGLTCTATGEGGKSTGYTPTGYQEKNELESISLTLTPSTIKYGATSEPTTTATYTSGGTKNVTATYKSSDENVVKVE